MKWLWEVGFVSQWVTGRLRDTVKKRSIVFTGPHANTRIKLSTSC